MRRGNRVSPAWKWKTSKCRAAQANARSCFGRLNGMLLLRLVSWSSRFTSKPRSKGRSLKTSSVLSTPSSRRPCEIAPGPPAMLIGEWRTLTALPSIARRIDRSFQTDTRAKLGRPEVGIASDASDQLFCRDVDHECVERLLGARVELCLVRRGEQQVAEPLGSRAERRQDHAFLPVEAGLVDAFQRE